MEYGTEYHIPHGSYKQVVAHTGVLHLVMCPFHRVAGSHARVA